MSGVPGTAATVTTSPLDNTTWVETPEHIRFRHHVAGPARRYLAYLLDLLIRMAMAAAVVFLVAMAAGGMPETSELGQGLLLLLFFGLEWAYYVLFETLGGGRTPGKRALGLRVVKEGGHAPSFIDSVLRNLLRAADLLPFGYIAGVLSMIVDRRFRRLGDRVAGTMVVIEESANVPSQFVLQPPPQAAELDALPGRPPLSAFERESIERFLRRTFLSLPRRQELAEQVAPMLARRMGLSPSSLPGGDAVRFLSLLHLRAQPHKPSPAPHGEAR